MREVTEVTSRRSVALAGPLDRRTQVNLCNLLRSATPEQVARLRTIDQPIRTRGQAMNNRLTQLIAEMDKDDAKKIEALTGVIAIGGHLREVAAD